MQQFPPIDPDATKVLTFDCTPQMQPNEVLMGGITLKNVVCTAGNDLSAAQIVIGPASYDVSGRLILLPVSNLSSRNGNDYEFELTSGTNLPPNVIVARALLPVRVT